jgi:hypothetical protein
MLKKLFSLFKTKTATRRRKTNKHKKYKHKTNKRTKRAYKMRGG